MKKLTLATLFIVVVLLSCNTKSWKELKNEDDLLAYEEFLSNKPETEHKDSIMLLMANIEWKSVIKNNTIGSIDSFELKYAGIEEYINSISNQKKKIIWENCMKTNTIKAYQNFVLNNKQSSYLNIANKKIEKLEWLEIKYKNNHTDYLGFIAKYSFKNYKDSIGFKLSFRDFIGYSVSFESNELEENSTSEIITLDFNSDGELTGVYDGTEDSEDYLVGWGGEIRGNFDDHGLGGIEQRLTEFSDEEEFEAEEWSDFNLNFNDNEFLLETPERKYSLSKFEQLIERQAVQ